MTYRKPKKSNGLEKRIQDDYRSLRTPETVKSGGELVKNNADQIHEFHGFMTKINKPIDSPYGQSIAFLIKSKKERQPQSWKNEIEKIETQAVDNQINNPSKFNAHINVETRQELVPSIEERLKKTGKAKKIQAAWNSS